METRPPPLQVPELHGWRGERDRPEIYYEVSFRVFSGKRPTGVFVLQREMKINCVPRC